jgi:nucleoside-diphosphate-sugar epimerase
MNLLERGSLGALPRDYGAIVHLAAILGVERVSREPLSVLRDNLEMTLEVLALARRQAGLHRLVFASTSEVYAGTLEKFGLAFPTPESTPLALPDLGAPRTSYMLSKIYGEALVRQSGLPFTILRPHNIYGPRMGESHVVPQLMRRIWSAPEGAEVVVHSPAHRRTFCFAADAARLAAAALEAGACAGETLNLGNVEPEVAMAELAGLIASVVGRKVRLVPGQVTAGSPARRQPDISRLVALTGLRPEIGLREGLALTFSWYRDQAWAGAAAA